MRRRRVKITGIGPVTPAGIGREAFWRGILEPVSHVRAYTKLGEEFGPFVAAWMEDFDITRYVDRTMIPKGTSRQSLLAMAGAALALDDAKICRKELQGSNSIIITGSALMDFDGIGRAIEAVARRGPRAAQGRVLYTMGIASTPSAIAQGLGINARTMSISTQCTSGMSAIAHAAEMVSRGEADIAICGGTEAPLSRFPLLELKVVELTPASDEMPAHMARPFDLWRSTGVVAEGAAIVVLEPESSPRPGYSFIAGHGFDGDDRDQLCGGMEEAARQAMAEARIRPNSLDVLSAWGPGHRTIDLGEFEALSRLMPEILREIPAFSLKGAMGIPLGAAPAIQVAAASLGQAHGVIPPTVNWQYPDPSCPFNLSREARNIPHEWTLVTAHGAGGTNSAMLLQRC